MGNMTKKMRGHPLFAEAEDVVEAVYGLGKGTLATADSASRGLARSADRTGGTTNYASEHEKAVSGKDSFGFAASVTGNGVLALTNHRLLFFAKSTVIGRPKNLTVEIPLDHVSGAVFDRPMVSVSFADGSVCGLHVPRNQQPAAFVEAVNRTCGSAS